MTQSMGLRAIISTICVIVLLRSSSSEARRSAPALIEDDGLRRNNRPAGKNRLLHSFASLFVCSTQKSIESPIN